MPQFADAEGRTWNVRVTLGTLRDLEQAIGKPIFELIADPSSLRSEIIGSAEVIGKGLYLAVQRQAAERRVSQEAFFQAISGPAITDATRAWVEALAECFPVPDSSSPAEAAELRRAGENQAARPTSGGRGRGRISMALRRLLARLRLGRTRCESWSGAPMRDAPTNGTEPR